MWQSAIGYSAPSYKGANASVIEPENVFNAFDRIHAFAFAPNQQAEIQAVLAGDSHLCCDEIYKCCPRSCEYSKIDEACVGKCAVVPDDPTCVEETCSEDDMIVRLGARGLEWLYLDCRWQPDLCAELVRERRQVLQGYWRGGGLSDDHDA